MPMSFRSLARAWRGRRPTLLGTLAIRAALVAFVAMAGLTGCANVPKPATPLPFDAAIDSATDALLRQAQPLGGLLAGQRSVVLDPSLDAATGQQTAATQHLDQALADRVRASDRIALLPFEASNLSKAQALLVGTLVAAPESYRLNLALVDLKSGAVQAQASALVRKDGVDMRPLAYYRDSPVLIRDKVIDGYVRTAATPAGQPADALYLARISAATVINDATVLYNAARYREALGQYRSALASPAGDQIRALTGVYLSAARLGQTAEAEEAFARLAAFGLAYDNLNVKFLFNPGSTEFWSDPKVSGACGMWLRQLARQASLAKICMDVVGHTSKTGTEAANDTLSMKRALFIKQRLSAESPDLARRTTAQGMGSRQTIVGSGTDDVVDAPDRRVEFTIVDCAAR
jgi:tetratricopeptide (TPR) repeat protein